MHGKDLQLALDGGGGRQWCQGTRVGSGGRGSRQAQQAAQVFLQRNPLSQVLSSRGGHGEAPLGQALLPWCGLAALAQPLSEPESQNPTACWKKTNNFLTMTLLTTWWLLVSFFCPGEWPLAALVKSGLWRQPVVPPAQPRSSRLRDVQDSALEATRCQGYSVAGMTATRCGTAGLTGRRQVPCAPPRAGQGQGRQGSWKAHQELVKNPEESGMKTLPPCLHREQTVHYLPLEWQSWFGLSSELLTMDGARTTSPSGAIPVARVMSVLKTGCHRSSSQECAFIARQGLD